MMTIYDTRGLNEERRRLDDLRRKACAAGDPDLAESFRLQVELIDAKIARRIEHLKGLLDAEV